MRVSACEIHVATTGHAWRAVEDTLMPCHVSRCFMLLRVANPLQNGHAGQRVRVLRPKHALPCRQRLPCHVRSRLMLS